MLLTGSPCLSEHIIYGKTNYLVRYEKSKFSKIQSCTKIFNLITAAIFFVVFSKNATLIFVLICNDEACAIHVTGLEDMWWRTCKQLH